MLLAVRGAGTRVITDIRGEGALDVGRGMFVCVAELHHRLFGCGVFLPGLVCQL